MNRERRTPRNPRRQLAAVPDPEPPKKTAKKAPAKRAAKKAAPKEDAS